MNKPSFEKLQSNYASNKSIDRETLYTEIGWKDLINNPVYKNTCAVRISLALIKSGISVQGRMKINSGPHKNMLIEPGQHKLSEMLASPTYFGGPEKFSTKDAMQKIGNRKGIISFMNIPGYNGGQGGHIDLVSTDTGGYYACASDCFWDAKEIWFWELK